jgi:hypothetical protein
MQCGQISIDGGLDNPRRGYPGGEIDDFIPELIEFEGDD